MPKINPFIGVVLMGIFILCLVFISPASLLAEEHNIVISNMDEEKVWQVVYNPAPIDKIKLLSNQSEKGSFDISYDLFRELALRNISLVMCTSLGEIVFDPAKMDWGLTYEFGDKLNKTRIKITIEKAAEPQITMLDRFIQNLGMQKAIAPVLFRTEAVTENRTLVLSSVRDYVAHKFVVPEGLKPELAVGVVLQEDGTIIPVPTRFITENGRNIAIIKTQQLGVYAVVKGGRTFADISTHWAKEDINLLAAKLIVNGVQDNSFAPETKVSRAQFASMLTRSFGRGSSKINPGFKDVKTKDWYYSNIALAVQSRIIRGYPSGVFLPNRLLTREEAAVLAVRALKFAGQDIYIAPSEVNRILGGFKDVAGISSWARSELALAVKKGIMQGPQRGKFAPKASCTRAEMVVILRRVLVNSGLLSPSVIVTAPAENFYTNKDKVTMYGRIKPGNQLRINEDKLATNIDDGSFKTEIKLGLGTNNIRFADEDNFGMLEKTVRTVVYDNTPPSLTVTNPLEKEIVVLRQIMVKGYTEPGCVVKINDNLASTDGSGNFNSLVTLVLGRNLLDIIATDPAGNVSSTKRVVYCAPNKISSFTVAPNPIKLGDMVNIRYLLEQDAYVSIEVFTENGDKVKTIQSSLFLTSRNYNNFWDGKDNKGSLVPDGKYKFLAEVRNSNGEVLAKVEKTVTAARVPNIITDLDGLPVFSPSDTEVVTIPYTVYSDSKVTVTILKGYNRKVKTLIEDLYTQAGTHRLIWDGRDENGEFCGDGTYTCTINAVAPEVSKFKDKSEFRFIIEREPPRIIDFTANPNTFRINGPGLNIRYKLSENVKVTLKVLDSNNRFVGYVFNNSFQESGTQNVIWNGTDEQGNLVPEGTYRLELKAVDSFGKDSETVSQAITAGYEPIISNITFKPLPFRVGIGRSANISFDLSNDAIVTVEIKVQWVAVKTLVINSMEKAGKVTIRWDGSDDYGYLVGEGLYNLEIKAVSPTVDRFKNSFLGNIDVIE